MCSKCSSAETTTDNSANFQEIGDRTDQINSSWAEKFLNEEFLSRQVSALPEIPGTKAQSTNLFNLPDLQLGFESEKLLSPRAQRVSSENTYNQEAIKLSETLSEFDINFDIKFKPLSNDPSSFDSSLPSSFPSLGPNSNSTPFDLPFKPYVPDSLPAGGQNSGSDRRPSPAQDNGVVPGLSNDNDTLPSVDTNPWGPSQTQKERPDKRENAGDGQDRNMEPLGQVRLQGGFRARVIIDSGHSSRQMGSKGDPGASVNVDGQTITEGDLAYQISSKLTQELRKMGVSVERTNPTGQFVSLGERSRIANQDRSRVGSGGQEYVCSPDAFVSIHLDSAGNTSAHGAHVNYSGSRGEAGGKLASLVMDSMESSLGVRRHMGGVVNRSLSVTVNTDAPAILIETGFITNPQERAKLMDPGYQRQMARSIAAGIGRFLEGRQGRCSSARGPQVFGN